MTIGMLQTCIAKLITGDSKRIANERNFFTLLLLLVFLILALSPLSLAQKRSDRSKSDTKPAKNDTAGPKRTDRTIPESERVKVITRTEFIRVPVNPNIGYLVLFAVPKAVVTLTPLSANQKNFVEKKYPINDPDGSIVLQNLYPGKYKLTIEHQDYSPYSETIQVDLGPPEPIVATKKMVSLYGVIRLVGLLPGSKVFLDEQALKQSELKQDNQNVTIERIPVGNHHLKVSKVGYVDINKEVKILPGEEYVISAQLDLAMVTVSLTSMPGARVYVGNVEKATIPPNGKVEFPLPVGRHSIRVLKDGYQEETRELSLSLMNNAVNERFELVPIPNSAEGNWDPSFAARKWTSSASGWRFDATGALIRGDKLVLFDTESDPGFNIYRDFQLVFDVVFTNDKGVAWVARAKDANNYYLFEISNPQTNPTLNFYVCRDGNLEWKTGQRIVEKLDKKDDSFTITFVAQRNRFDTGIEIASAPSEKPHKIGIFQDDTFTYGGVGFRGKELSQAMLKSFFVTPQN